MMMNCCHRKTYAGIAAGLLLGLLLGVAGNSFATIPVIDPAHIIETLVQTWDQYEHLAEMARQTQELYAQVQMMEANLERVENLAQLFRDPENFVGAATAEFSWISAFGLGTPETAGLGWVQEDIFERATTLFPGTSAYAGPGETPYGPHESFADLHEQQLAAERNNQLAMFDILYREDLLRGEALRAAREIRDELTGGEAGAERTAELSLALESIGVEETVVDRHLQMLRAQNETVERLRGVSARAQQHAATLRLLQSTSMPERGSYPVEIIPGG